MAGIPPGYDQFTGSSKSAMNRTHLIVYLTLICLRFILRQTVYYLRFITGPHIIYMPTSYRTRASIKSPLPQLLPFEQINKRASWRFCMTKEGDFRFIRKCHQFYKNYFF